MNIVVGITGGIAAYKTPDLVRRLVKAGHEVQCAATAHALQFVTPLALETVSGRTLYSDLFATTNARSTEHIALKDWADMFLVAPATANIIGKMASGIADDALSTLLLAARPERVVLCPAMNSDMWAHPAVGRNLEQLRSWGVSVVGPDDGPLACGTSGKGRMVEPEAIVAAVQDILHKGNLSGQRWLVTAGPTYERIDSVRFIGNYSSGKMGFALAEALAKCGAEVHLVTGPTALSTSMPCIVRHDIESAQQMFDICTAIFPQCDGAILSAAVADYRPETCADHKLKKQGDEGMTIRLVQNPDILATLGTLKREGQTLVGFALETDNELTNAQSKLERKRLDYIVLNSLRDAGAGFRTDTNKVSVISATGTITELPLDSKAAIARSIVSIVTDERK